VDETCLVAGVPAKSIKSGVTWSRPVRRTDADDARQFGKFAAD
jgi:hypothetical protein